MPAIPPDASGSRVAVISGREGAPLRRRSSCRSRPGDAHFNLPVGVQRRQLKFMPHFKVISRIHQEEPWIPIDACIPYE